MILIHICLITLINSFDDKYRFSKKKPIDLSPVTFFYKEKSDEFIKDIPKILKTFNTTRIIFKDGFIFSRQILEFKKIGLHKIYCISDSLFSQDSAQICMRKDMIRQYYGSTFFIIDFKVSKIGMFEISFLHIKQKAYNLLDVLNSHFEVDYPTISQTIRIKLSPINCSIEFGQKLKILGFYSRFYPFVSWLGYSLLNPAYYEYNHNSIAYPLQTDLNIHLVNYLYSDSFEVGRLLKTYISIGIATCCIYMIIFLLFQVISSSVCNFVKEFYFQPDISLYSMAFGLFMIIDIMSGNNFWIWLKPITPYLLLFSGISIINKFTLYSLSTFIVSLNEIRRKKSNIGRTVFIQNHVSVFLTLCTLFSCLIMQNNNGGEITKASFSINENIIKAQAFPIIIFFLLIYTVTTVMALLPNLYFFKINIKIYRASKDIVRGNLNSRMFSIAVSFLCVLTLSLSFLFYIISAKVMWLHQSCFYLFFSYLFYAFYLSIFLLGFNREINIMIYDYIKSIFNTNYHIPHISSSNKSSSFSKDSGIQVFPKMNGNNTFKDNSRSVNYFGWIDSYFDKPPVFRNQYSNNGRFELPLSAVSNSSSGFESQIPPPIWKSSGFCESNKQFTNQSISDTYNQSSNIYMLNDQEFTAEMFKSLLSNIEMGNNSILYSTSTPDGNNTLELKDSTNKVHKKYRVTPVKINQNHEDIRFNCTLSFEQKDFD